MLPLMNGYKAMYHLAAQDWCIVAIHGGVDPMLHTLISLLAASEVILCDN